MAKSKMSAITQLALAAGLFPMPRKLFSDVPMSLDPLIIPFNIPASVQTLNEETDITDAELPPAMAPTNGILASRGDPDAYVGYIYGVTVAMFGEELAADLQIMLSGAELMLQSGGRVRGIPFRSALRVQPHVVDSPATAATAMAATCGAPGSPAYVLPVEPVPWTGVASCSIIRRTNATYTPGSILNGQVEIWGIFARGEAADVEGDSCSIRKPEDVVGYLQARAAIRAAVQSGSVVTPAALTLLSRQYE